MIRYYEPRKGSWECLFLPHGGSPCNKVHSLTTYSDNFFAFGDSCIKAYNHTVKQCSVMVGNGNGTKDGSKAQFPSQKASALIMALCLPSTRQQVPSV